jgi:hypothetical protein
LNVCDVPSKGVVVLEALTTKGSFLNRLIVSSNDFEEEGTSSMKEATSWKPTGIEMPANT